jgi:hypothetical protein
MSVLSMVVVLLYSATIDPKEKREKNRYTTNN